MMVHIKAGKETGDVVAGVDLAGVYASAFEARSPVLVIRKRGPAAPTLTTKKLRVGRS